MNDPKAALLAGLYAAQGASGENPNSGDAASMRATMASVFSGVGSPASEATAAASAVASLGAPKDLKEKGNAAMAAGDAPEAVRLWSNAVHALSHSSSLQSSTSSADADLLTSLLSNLSLGLLKLTNPLFPVDALTASLYHAEAALLVSPLHKNARLRRARCFALCGMEGAARGWGRKRHGRGDERS